MKTEIEKRKRSNSYIKCNNREKEINNKGRVLKVLKVLDL